MKICMVAGREFFHPFDQRVYKEAKALHDAGFEVTLVTPDPEDGKDKVEGIPVLKVSTKTRGTTARKMVAAARKVECDAYHAHEFDGGYVGAALKVLTGKKIFYDVHDEVPAILAEIKKNPKLEKVYDPLERQIIRAMHGIIMAEDSYRNRYNKLHNNTIVIHNYPIFKLFRDRADSNKKQKQSTMKLAEKLESKFVIGYVGGLAVRRGLLVMLEAMNELKDEQNLCFLFVGKYDRKDDEKKAKKLIKKYDLQDKIVHEKWIEYRKLPAYIDLMDIGLVLLQPLPRLMGITPTKLFEYMACGKPVIASKLPGLEKIVGDCNCGLLVEHDASTMLAESIRKLYNSPNMCNKFGKKGYNAVRDIFNWELESEKLVKFYNDNLE